MSYSGLILDIDGTLLRGDMKELSAYDIKAIHDIIYQGITVIIATGRSRFNTERIIKQLNVNQPTISLYGAHIFDTQSNKVFEMTYPMSRRSVEILNDWAEKRNICTHFVTCEGTITFGNDKLGNLAPFLSNIFDDSEKQHCCFNNILQVVLPITDRLLYFSIMKLIHKENLDCRIYIRSKDIVCLSKKTSKGIALKYLASQNDWDLKKFIGIGDDLADLPIFEAVGVGIGIDNGNDRSEIANYVKEILTPNTPNLIAYCIKKYFNEHTN